MSKDASTVDLSSFWIDSSSPGSGNTPNNESQKNSFPNSGSPVAHEQKTQPVKRKPLDFFNKLHETSTAKMSPAVISKPDNIGQTVANPAEDTSPKEIEFNNSLIIPNQLVEKTPDRQKKTITKARVESAIEPPNRRQTSPDNKTPIVEKHKSHLELTGKGPQRTPLIENKSGKRQTISNFKYLFSKDSTFSRNANKMMIIGLICVFISVIILFLNNLYFHKKLKSMRDNFDSEDNSCSEKGRIWSLYTDECKKKLQEKYPQYKRTIIMSKLSFWIGLLLFLLSLFLVLGGASISFYS